MLVSIEAPGVDEGIVVLFTRAEGHVPIESE